MGTYITYLDRYSELTKYFFSHLSGTIHLIKVTCLIQKNHVSPLGVYNCPKILVVVSMQMIGNAEYLN